MSISPVKIWRNQKKIINILGKKGKIISWSIVHIPPMGHENIAPYPVVIVEFERGDRYIGQLTDWEEENLYINQKVQAVLRKTREIGMEGVIPYGIKFKPL